jgi:hypothetical protein
MVVVDESLERVLLGWGSGALSDERLLERGMELVEGLYLDLA